MEGPERDRENRPHALTFRDERFPRWVPTHLDSARSSAALRRECVTPCPLRYRPNRFKLFWFKGFQMKTVLALAALLFLFTGSLAWGHGGGLNTAGCHNERRTGGYHCHRSGYSPPAPQGLYRAAPSSGQSRDVVIAAQTLLNHLGCDAGTPDGGAGALTGAAIDRFATATGRAGGAVDAGLVRRLAEAVAAGERC